MSTHILVFPYPAQGHMLALLDLTHQLSLRGLTITILTTPKNLPFLSPLLSSHPSSIHPLILPFPSHPLIPPNIENVKDLGNAGNIPMMAALRKLQEPLIQWFKSHPNPPVAILSDFFLGWTHHLATLLKIPRIAFFVSSAFFACVCHHLWNNVDKVMGLSEVQFDHLPGSPIFKYEHLPSLFRKYMEIASDHDADIISNGMIANTNSWSCVFLSFDALENENFRCFKTIVGHNRVFAVAPLSSVGPDVSSRGNSDSGSGLNNEISVWLDGCPEGSVVYVCFGSQKLLKNEQLEALAYGLEKSGLRFIWVVKTGTAQQQQDGYGVIPDGFEGLVMGRGMVIKGWTPQVLILSHKAVGGFVSHCGWNSVLEGILRGVMLLAWPMEAEQFLNAWIMVDEMGVAIRVCEGADTVPDSDELGRKINEAMSESGVKERVKELKERALEAVKDGGSSMEDLDKFVTELGQLGRG